MTNKHDYIKDVEKGLDSKLALPKSAISFSMQSKYNPLTEYIDVLQFSRDASKLLDPNPKCAHILEGGSPFFIKNLL